MDEDLPDSQSAVFQSMPASLTRLGWIIVCPWILIISRDTQRRLLVSVPLFWEPSCPKKEASWGLVNNSIWDLVSSKSKETRLISAKPPLGRLQNEHFWNVWLVGKLIPSCWRKTLNVLHRGSICETKAHFKDDEEQRMHGLVLQVEIMARED